MLQKPNLLYYYFHQQVYKMKTMSFSISEYIILFNVTAHS